MYRNSVCEQQLERRLREMSRRSPKRRGQLLALLDEIDLDAAETVSGYDKRLIQVPPVCARCRRKHCRYLDFLDDCGRTPYLFQICNHNLFIADAVRRERGNHPLFPDYCSVIIDEAHKLPETARDMLELTLDGQDIREVIRRLQKNQFLLAAENLSDSSTLLLKKLDAPPQSVPFQNYARLLSPSDRMLKRIRHTLDGELSPSLLAQIDDLASRVSFFYSADEAETLLYTGKTDEERTLLGATLPDLTEQFRNILWNPLDSALLVSGTLAVNGDFTRYKTAAGLTSDRRVGESVFPSPFDYKKNCLLYFPLTPPRTESSGYIEQLTDEIAGLLNAANGHALALFTSYAQLTAVKKALAQHELHWRVYATSGNAACIANQFRKDPGSVLLATGSLWEGMNFPGDGVSLLVIPRLPFPYPDAIAEFERKKYESLQAYIQAVALPDMLMKLRQGFGRAIRTETDTCVAAILDERAAPGGRYYHDILSTLPKMRITQSLQDVADFIHRVKPERYFKERLDDERKE